MRFLPSDEQQMLREAAAVGFARDGAAADLGLEGLLRPAAEGGLGLGMVEAAIVLHEAGRAGADMALATRLLFAEAAPAGGGVALPVEGALTEAEGRLRGRLLLDLWPDSDRIAAPLGQGDRVALLAVDAVSTTARPGIVPGQQSMQVDVDLAADAVPVLELPGWRDRLAVLLAAWVLGSVDRSFAMTLDYLRDRSQFGQPIGANQAVKHIAADSYLAVENIRIAVDLAAAALDVATAEPGLAADALHAMALLRATVPDSARALLETAIHLHGGIGLTWDYGLNQPLRGVLRAGQVIGSPTPHLCHLCDLFHAAEGEGP